MKSVQPNIAHTTVSKLGRSLGSAARLVRQLVPRRRSGGTRTSETSAALRDYERARRSLSAEVASLEAEVERLHALITSNALPLHGQPGGKASLRELLDESRQKRELCHEKRQELLRVERHIHRERRLSPLEPADAKVSRRAPPAERVSPRTAAQTARTMHSASAAVARALDRRPPGNEAERLAFQRLVERLTDDDPDVRRDAVARLSAHRGPDVPELLLSAVDDDNARVRVSALNALVGSNHRAAADAFRRYLHDDNAALRLSALRGLASLDEQYLSSSALIARLEDRDAAIRRTAANILGWRRGDSIPADVVNALALALHDDDEDVRAAVVEALGNLGDHRGVLSIIFALQDSASQVVEAADRALSAVLGEQATGIGAGKAPAERALALREWWKDARADAYLAAHAGELPMDGTEPALPPPAPRAAPRAEPRVAVERPPPEPARKQARPPLAPAEPAKAPAPAAPKAAQAKAEATPAAIADAFAEMEDTGEEAAGDESAEDFETMFGAGGEEAEAGEAEAEATSESGEAESEATKPAATEATEEEAEGEGEGEEGGFEDLFGGGGEEGET